MRSASGARAGADRDATPLTAAVRPVSHAGQLPSAVMTVTPADESPPTFGVNADCARGVGCSRQMVNHGGVDVHHVWPLSWGGTPTGERRLLCPNHHRRQHSLLAAWQVAGGAPTSGILRHFTPAERTDAAYAYFQWDAAGRPPIHGEPAPPAE